MLTQHQIRDRSKTVTRRLGWKTLKPGTMLRGVEKAIGLKKSESMRDLSVIYVTAVSHEPLYAITQEDVRREGFPHMTRDRFIAMFCEHMGCNSDQSVTRIEFKYIPGATK